MRPVDGISKAQEEKLRRKKKSTETEEKLWKAMYCILFPDDDEDTITSPCKIMIAGSIQALTRPRLRGSCRFG
jgi:hypothetical protein